MVIHPYNNKTVLLRDMVHLTSLKESAAVRLTAGVVCKFLDIIFRQCVKLDYVSTSKTVDRSFSSARVSLVEGLSMRLIMRVKNPGI